MKQRGRESEAALEVAELAPKIGRPDPPDYLDENEARIWRDIVETEPAGWFKQSQYGYLANLCSLQAWCNDLRKSKDATSRAEFLRYSHELVAIARALRLTHQSRYYPETAGKKASATGGPRPWEVKAG